MARIYASAITHVSFLSGLNPRESCTKKQEEKLPESLSLIQDYHFDRQRAAVVSDYDILFSLSISSGRVKSLVVGEYSTNQMNIALYYTHAREGGKTERGKTERVCVTETANGRSVMLA